MVADLVGVPGEGHQLVPPGSRRLIAESVVGLLGRRDMVETIRLSRCDAAVTATSRGETAAGKGSTSPDPGAAAGQAVVRRGRGRGG